MSEIERENILAQRQEEMQRIQDKRNLDQMLRERTGGAEESVSKAAKRTGDLSLSVSRLLIPYSRSTRTARCYEREITQVR